MKKIVEISREDAIDRTIGGKDVFVLNMLSCVTPLSDLRAENHFVILEEVEEEQKEQPKKELAKKEAKPAVKTEGKRVDHGKIIALHNANWSTKKIAEEIGCSEQTVKNHIEREGKKEE